MKQWIWILSLEQSAAAAAAPVPIRDGSDPRYAGLAALLTPGAMGFFEVFWHGEAIGDGSDLDEALTAYLAVKPEEGSWAAACADAQAQPCVRRYASFEAYLDNADELETIPVTAAMIEAALLRIT